MPRRANADDVTAYLSAVDERDLTPKKIIPRLSEEKVKEILIQIVEVEQEINANKSMIETIDRAIITLKEHKKALLKSIGA